MRKVLPYRFVPQTSYTVEQFDRWTCGSGYPPPEPPFLFARWFTNYLFFPVTPAKKVVRKSCWQINSMDYTRFRGNDEERAQGPDARN